MQVPGSFHQAPGLLGDVAFFKTGVHKHLKVLRDYRPPPPAFALLPQQRQSGEKGGDQLPLASG